MHASYVMTSESLTDGHPDKLCDQISDAIVGRFLRQDSSAQLVAECAVSTGIVFIAVKYLSDATVDVGQIARGVVRHIGYDTESFNAESCTVMVNLHEYPAPFAPLPDERALSDEEIDRITAKNQATLFGFACRQTPALMPLPIWLAHKLARRLAAARRSELPYLAPDAQTQVGVEYSAHRPRRIHGLTLLASQREESAPSERRLRDDLFQAVIEPAFADEGLRPDDATRVAINPEGPIGPGGPAFHAGLTGRKNGVDTYGEYARHSGAALSGKDPSRVDRSGAYAARWAAKNVVAAGLADECEVSLSYSVGLAGPASIRVETFGTGKLPDEEIARRLENELDLRVAGIVRQLRLRDLPRRDESGLYPKLACYGHVGRMDLDLPWERTDKADALR